MSGGHNGAAIAVANAPVSYGAFELTVGHVPGVPDGVTVLDQVAAAVVVVAVRAACSLARAWRSRLSRSPSSCEG